MTEWQPQRVLIAREQVKEGKLLLGAVLCFVFFLCAVLGPTMDTDRVDVKEMRGAAKFQAKEVESGKGK